MRLLIANRGEIARRVLRTAHRLGHTTVAVYADPDASAPFVAEATQAIRIGPAELAKSYLSIDRLVEAASATGADGIHPGYGFLSENAAFARAVIDRELIWVGPSPGAIERMGSKIEARRLASSADVPVIPGFDESQHVDDLRDAAASIGYPVLIKAAAGGGGKGIRIAGHADEFDRALNEARQEARRSFGDDDVIVERYIQRPRHVEVQIVGDRHGAVIELGTRECSVQRRYQKLLEEAPAPNLEPATRTGLRAAAVALAQAIGYDSAGTVEFVVDDDTGDFFFLEMNTRLQVEHPVTEEITGIDLVELQLSSATGHRLPIAQDDVTFDGHAFEARINAEDAARDFAPQTGTVSHLHVPAGVRWDSGIEQGSEVSPHYDPMVAKLVVWGPDRATARRRLADALDELLVGGLVTNGGFHRWLIDQDPLVEGRVTTRFLDDVELPGPASITDAALVAGARWLDTRRSAAAPGPWSTLGAHRIGPHTSTQRLLLRSLTGEVVEVPLHGPDQPSPLAADVDLDAGSVVVNDSGHCHTFTVVSRAEHWAPDEATGHGHAGAIVAPFPAVVTEVTVAPGDIVAGGDPVVVIEAMKMLHTLPAAGPGTVAEVRVEPGDQIESGQILVTFVAPDGPTHEEEPP